MKKILIISAAICIIVIAAVLVFSPFNAVSQQKITQTSLSIPDSVAVILRNSCSSCHGEGGNGMAMSVWNFSVWDTYNVKKQAKKAKAICKAMTKGSMPPGSEKKAYPEKIPTTAQTEIICRWAGTLKVK